MNIIMQISEKHLSFCNEDLNKAELINEDLYFHFYLQERIK